MTSAVRAVNTGMRKWLPISKIRSQILADICSNKVDNIMVLRFVYCYRPLISS